MRFYKAPLEESGEPLANPDCGWYHIYPFAFKEAPGRAFPDLQLLSDSLRESGERLALLQFDIGFFREEALSAGALGRMEALLDCFRQSGKQLILRVAYDLEGRGLWREPESETLVRRHMEQLGPLIRDRAGDILTLQGIFVGSWGEMHGSRFLSEPAMARLTLSLYRAVEGRCFLAVRTPAQWRALAARLAGEPGLVEKLTLFNDGLFGSETDLGTYAPGRSRRRELEWQSRTMTRRPVGGETVAAPSPVGWRQAAAEMEKLHLCYLNSAYHKKQLDFWRGETVDAPGCWRGVSGYDCIGRRLGPRFVVRDAVKAGRTLRVAIENRGFSGVCRETDCFLILERRDGPPEAVRLETEVAAWGKRVRLPVPLPPESRLSGPLELFLELRRREDGQAVRFANRDAGDRVRLGHLGPA